MDRLTERFSNGQAAVYGCGSNCRYDFKYCSDYLKDCPVINEIYERLAQYEDIGLTPEQLLQVDEMYTDKCREIAGLERKIKDCGVKMRRLTYSGTKEAKTDVTIRDALNKLAEYEDLEEQGKLLKLPCAMGNTVYTIYSSEDDSFIEEAKVEEVSTHRIWIDSVYFDYDDFGKSVFLTREEAEAALKKI